LKNCGAGGLDEGQCQIVKGFIQEAIDEDFKLIMIRPNMVC
jgi:deoxyribose-phosphate aldolase